MLRPYKGRRKGWNGWKSSCAEILVGGIGGARFGPVVTLGAGDVDDDLRLFFDGLGFEDDGAVGVEELVGDVGEDGGAAWGDATFGYEEEKAGEELADVGAGGEFGEFGEKVGGEVFGVIELRL
jgi:hypothetical protein